MPRGGDSAPSTPDLIVTVISKLLTELVARNDQLPLVPTQVTPFHSSKPPTISVKSYLEDRILKYAGCSEETFILALIYMDQVVQFNPDFVISSLNVHRLLITSVMLASKFFDDVYYNNAYYARVGGISNAEVNSLEMEMLRMISFSLFVQPDQYEKYRGSLYSHLAPRQDTSLPMVAQQQLPCQPAVGGYEAAVGASDPMVM
uniref:Cyclin n=1 Tax=Calcidiscus leptoporus TaxID=127549 RepID=A0A7S0J7V7_9EUKA|mmetsp:Transcript_42439/g.99397  ORF Transcript_42439/g.99397 Transcript_42439/m.99397 type:complete len:203 (+) Transcript_42439:151-759(+)